MENYFDRGIGKPLILNQGSNLSNIMDEAEILNENWFEIV